MKTENNKKNNKKVTVWALVTIHIPDLKKKKRKAENVNAGDVDAQTKRTLHILW